AKVKGEVALVIAGANAKFARPEAAGERPGGDEPFGWVETIARGVCVRDGRALLCRGKGAKSTYLPGGHIEFGETGAEALVREIKEETGLDSTAGRLLGVVENTFLQKGERHCEINLVYELALADGDVAAQESWIEFEWRALDDLDAANLLPAEMKGYLRK
ncbi:MAG: NUDIX domain-containing protein, partial [Kiritimatiellae bacterium]|nr:NUDIX domain-containing protein [Kiritimatiellia bacterium]